MLLYKNVSLVDVVALVTAISLLYLCTCYFPSLFCHKFTTLMTLISMGKSAVLLLLLINGARAVLCIKKQCCEHLSLAISERLLLFCVIIVLR